MPLTSSQLEEFLNHDDSIKPIFSNILNLNLQCQTSEGLVISFVNKLLSVSKSRLQGLECLNLIINNCSSGIIKENALNWINHCLVKYSGDGLKEMKLISIGKIIEVAHKEQEFTKRFVSEYISKVLEICLSPHTDSQEKKTVLDTLTICMKRYASWFTNHKVRIETFLLQSLEDSSELVVQKAAIAFHHLQQVGSGGVGGVNHMNNFSESFQKLCSTVHSLFDEFLENETEIEQLSRNNIEAYKFNDASVDSLKMVHVLSRHIKNCLIFITTMLGKAYPVAKEIKPIELLDLIRRGTMFHRCPTVDGENSLTSFQFSLLLNDVQIKLLQLLRIFIIWLNIDSLPFSFLISKILTDCLKRCQNCSCFMSNCLYQKAVYKCLNEWIQIGKCSLQPHFQSQLITCILKDIIPVKTKVSLNITAESAKNKSKKAKRKALQEKIIASSQDNSNLNRTVDQKLTEEKKCSLALDTLEHLLTNLSLEVGTNLEIALYSSVINTLIEISTSEFHHPYTNEECQVKLYQALGAFFEQDNLKKELKKALSIHVVLNILSNGSNRSNRHISTICQQSLRSLEKLCQPVGPTIGIPDVFTTMKPGIVENADDEMEITTDNVPNDSEAADLSWDDADSEKTVEWETSTKINIQEVKIIKKSTSMEVSNPGSEEKSHNEENISCKETFEADVTDHLIAVENTDLPLEVADTEEKIVKEEILSRSEIQPEEVEENSPTKDSESKLSNVKNEISNNSDDKQEKEQVLKVSNSMSVDLHLEPQQTEDLASDSIEPANKNVAPKEDECEEEPPLKKSRVDEGLPNDADLKREQSTHEEIDDVFDEDDSFIDVVRDDY